MAKRATVGKKRTSGAKRDLTGKTAGKPTKADIRAAAIAINVADKKAKITEAMAYIDERTDRRKQINAEVQAKRDELQAIGIEKKAFDWARKLIEMDPEDRAAMIESLGLSLEARGLGRQGDLWSDTEDRGEPGNDAFDHNDNADRAGFKAASEGRLQTENPHAPETGEHEAWDAGWLRQTEQHVHSMAAGEGETAH